MTGSFGVLTKALHRGRKRRTMVEIGKGKGIIMQVIQRKGIQSRTARGQQGAVITRIILVLVLSVILFGAGVATGYAWRGNGEPTVSATTIQTQLTDCSDLATSKLDYNGIVRFEQGDIPFINEKSFTMTYSATVTAGVDLSQAKVTVSGKDIKVVLPKATLQSVAINPDSLNFYDTKWSVLNWESRDDTTAALQSALDDVNSKVDETTMMSQADDQAKTVVTNLLAPFTSDDQGYTLTVDQAK